MIFCSLAPKKTWLGLGLLLTALVGCGQPEGVAKIDGQTLTQEEFNAYLKFKRIPQQDQGRVARALDDLVNREALVKAIEKEKALDPALLDMELAEFKRQMVISRYMDQLLRDKVTDEAVRNYYATHAADYESKNIHIAHILVRLNGKMAETERQAKLTTAQEIYSRLVKGDDFSALARASSEDTLSAKKGGDLGWMRQGAIDADFSKRVFAMKPGDISEPILTPFGYHLVKVIEGVQVQKKPLEAVMGEIRYQLRNETKDAEINRLLKSIEVEKQDLEKQEVEKTAPSKAAKVAS